MRAFYLFAVALSPAVLASQRKQIPRKSGAVSSSEKANAFTAIATHWPRVFGSLRSARDLCENAEQELMNIVNDQIDENFMEPFSTALKAVLIQRSMEKNSISQYLFELINTSKSTLDEPIGPTNMWSSYFKFGAPYSTSTRDYTAVNLLAEIVNFSYK